MLEKHIALLNLFIWNKKQKKHEIYVVFSKTKQKIKKFIISEEAAKSSELEHRVEFWT
jgi:hypothetical protein